ncbi:hypothetical protein Tco_0696060 [Tanacetum coccineum]
MNCRVDRSDLDAAVTLRRYGLDPLLPTLGHHSMSGIRGDILDVTTPLVGGCTTPPFDRYTVDETDHERYRSGSDPGPNPIGTAHTPHFKRTPFLSFDSESPTKKGQTRMPYLRLLRQAVDSLIREGKKRPKHHRCRTLEWKRKVRPFVFFQARSYDVIPYDNHWNIIERSERGTSLFKLQSDRLYDIFLRLVIYAMLDEEDMRKMGGLPPHSLLPMP